MSGVEVPALIVPKIVLVTGAGSGIGKACAARLASMGSTVIAGYNAHREAAENLVAALPGDGHMTLRIAIDDTASVTQAAQALSAQFGRIDALINNGGATTPAPLGDFDALSDEIFDRTVTVNLRGPFAMIRGFRALLERGESASIVNVSSIAARTGIGSSLAYLAAKAGVDALTIAMAKILAPKIRVFSVSPAGVDTEFVPGRTREQLEKTAERFPLAHVTMPDDVARAVVACIVNLTSSTGIVVPVDEGRHL